MGKYVERWREGGERNKEIAATSMTCIRSHFAFNYLLACLHRTDDTGKPLNYIIEFWFCQFPHCYRMCYCCRFGFMDSELPSSFDSTPPKNSNSIKHITRSIQANYTLESIHMHLENWLRTVDKNMRCEASNVNEYQGTEEKAEEEIYGIELEKNNKGKRKKKQTYDLYWRWKKKQIFLLFLANF